MDKDILWASKNVKPSLNYEHMLGTHIVKVVELSGIKLYSRFNP